MVSAASAAPVVEGCIGSAAMPLTLAETLTACLRCAGALLRRC